MQNFLLNRDNFQELSILCIGAHCDDIEIGCSGTLLSFLQSAPDTTINWVVCSSTAERKQETELAARRLGIGKRQIRLHFLDFRDGYLPWSGAEVKDALRRVTSPMTPNLVFTHYGEDLHQDHRLISELTWNLFRDHLILEYEVPKYDGDLGRPNMFMPLDSDIADEKIRLLLESYPSQSGKHWFSDETFRALLRIRGIESGRNNRYAEAFYSRKTCLAPS